MTRSSGFRRSSIALLAAVGAIVASSTLGSPPARADYTVQTGISYAGNSPSNPALNQLDLYLPAGKTDKLRPLVVWVHGGAWMIGDKSNRMADKARLFTDAGYIVASVNYRLSPDITEVQSFPSNRIRYPVHPSDTADALAWLNSNIGKYGGDPDAMLLTGHSAGGHLVSLLGSDPSWLDDRGISLKQVLGVVSLDAGALDLVDNATQTTPNPTDNNQVMWNAFGTPSEEAASPQWKDASPITWADSSDPRSLLVTQASKVIRIAENERMATALGQDPAGVFRAPLNHEGINLALGDPADTTGETQAVMAFIADRIASRVVPKVSVRKRPAKVVRVGRKRGGKLKKRQVSFAFNGSDLTESFQCRIDKASFKTCKSPRKFRVGGGKHTFRVRQLYPSGRPGVEKIVKFTVKAKKKHRRKHR